jgi:hypothetical protein
VARAAAASAGVLFGLQLGGEAGVLVNVGGAAACGVVGGLVEVRVRLDVRGRGRAAGAGAVARGSTRGCAVVAGRVDGLGGLIPLGLLGVKIYVEPGLCVRVERAIRFSDGGNADVDVGAGMQRDSPFLVLVIPSCGPTRGHLGRLGRRGTGGRRKVAHQSDDVGVCW